MAIATYINDLLYRYECVVLPEFGAFIVQKHSAGIDIETNKFYAPRKTVSFNGQLLKNDGLLANYIAEVQQLSFEEANQELKNFVQDLKEILRKEEEINFPNIGSFAVTENEKLQFEPAAKVNYLKESFGLDSFISEEILRKNNDYAVAPENPDTIKLNPEIKKSRPYIKYAAVGLLALGLSGFTGLNIYSNKITEHNVAEQLKAASQLEDQIQKATFIIENPLPAVTLKVAKQEGNFHIIAGAFRMEENAEEKVLQLKEEGFPARRMPENRYGLHQVIYSSFKSKRDAINTLHKIQRSSNSSAWLLVKEL